MLVVRVPRIFLLSALRFLGEGGLQAPASLHLPLPLLALPLLPLERVVELEGFICFTSHHLRKIWSTPLEVDKSGLRVLITTLRHPIPFMERIVNVDLLVLFMLELLRHVRGSPLLLWPRR